MIIPEGLFDLSVLFDDDIFMEHIILLLIIFIIKYLMPLWGVDVIVVDFCDEDLAEAALVDLVEVDVIDVLDEDVVQNHVVLVRMPAFRLDWHC